MTIEFNCPNCKAVIAFPDKHSGKRARCTTCQQRFIIPFKSFDKAKKVKPPKPEEKAEPIPGFYRAVFIESWKLFINFNNAADFIFLLVVVFFKFVMANQNINIFIQRDWLAFDIYIPLGWASRGAAWGCLFWFYSKMIYSTGFDKDDLPVVTVGGLYTFSWKIAMGVYSIFIILLVTGLPFVLAHLILSQLKIELAALTYPLLCGGLFLLPITILTIAIGRDFTMLRPDYLLVPIRRAFAPYFVTVVLISGALISQVFTPQYDSQSLNKVVIYFSLNVLLQAFILIAMRSIGLFYRHFSCHFIW